MRCIRPCLVEIGGELASRGLRADGNPWLVDPETPPDVMVPPIRLALHGIAVAASESSARGDHDIDAQTGRAPSGHAISATVIAWSAMLADALASAILVAHPTLRSNCCRHLPSAS